MDDFVADCDLYTACVILQKQIEHIDGKKENIIIPSLRLEQIRERNGTDYICILSILISCLFKNQLQLKPYQFRVLILIDIQI